MAKENGTVKIYYDDGRSEDYMLRSIRYELDDVGVALCTWNEPKSLNALLPNLVQETFIILEHARRDDAVKALVWTGEGRAWGSGAALGGDQTVHMPEAARAQYYARGLSWRQGAGERAFWVNLCLAFWDFPKTSVAAVNGLAVGGAVNVALCNYHDFVLCSDAAKFKFPFVELGATPELGSSKILPYLVGYAKAKEFLLLGEWFGPEEVSRLGLVTRVVPAAQLLPEALALARKVAAQPHQAAVTMGKQVLNRHLRQGLEEVLDHEQETINSSLRIAMKSGKASKLLGTAPKKSKL